MQRAGDGPEYGPLNWGVVDRDDAITATDSALRGYGRQVPGAQASEPNITGHGH